MIKKLVLVGCSWGCGEMNSTCTGVTHPGLGQYLSDSYDVVNLSRIGSSNWQNCFALRNYLNYVKNFDEYCIVVLQTDAYRRQACEKYLVDYNQLFENSHDLKHFYEQSLEIFYIKLNNLAEEFQTKIYLAGGLTDLALDIISMYTNLVPMCESWIKLMDPSHQPSIIPLIVSPELFKNAKQHNRLDLLEQISNHSDLNFLKAQKLMETEWFGPTFGDFHPSRKGHELLANYIKEFLKKESQ
jgi:hypothetical protein